MPQRRACVEFQTRRTSWVRYAKEVDTPIHIGPFRQIDTFSLGEQLFVPRIRPNNYPNPNWCWPTQSFVAVLPSPLANRLVEYVQTRLNGEDLPAGNCFEFASFMLGNDEPMLSATRRMNELLSVSRRISQPHLGHFKVPAGDIVLVAHPNHFAVGIKDEQGNRHPDYNDNGHGPLQIQHACVSIGSIESGLGQESWAIHRVGMDGALAIDPLSVILDGYRRGYLETLRKDLWEGDNPPASEDLNLYSISSNSSPA